MDQLPFEKDDTIVAFGDSSTDDLQGWFEIFKHLLEITVEGADYKFVNAGLSYNTTSEALRRMNRDVLSHEPDWVIVNLGTFDAIRPSFFHNRTLIPLSETWENLSTIEEAFAKILRTIRQRLHARSARRRAACCSGTRPVAWWSGGGRSTWRPGAGRASCTPTSG